MTLCSKDTWSFKEADLPSLDGNTKVRTEGPEKGVPHFYIDREDIPRLLSGFGLVSVRHVDNCYLQGRWQNNWHYHIEAERI